MDRPSAERRSFPRRTCLAITLGIGRSSPQHAQWATPKLGEPLNIIISALSDPFVLEEAGLRDYAKYVPGCYPISLLTNARRSIGFAGECLGLHYGYLHEADLGDGLGRKQEHMLVRQHYFPIVGTCWESVRGGHHFRAWRQNGTLANSGAWFIGWATISDPSYGAPLT